MATKTSKSNLAVIERAKKRLKIAKDLTKDNREIALSELTMLRGGKYQWDKQELNDRKHRPTVTVNGLHKFIRQVTGDMLLNDTTIKVRPDDDEATEDLAEVIAGKIAEIEYRSKAKDIYTGAAVHPSRCGWPGYFRVTTDFIDDKSFDQDIWIKPVFNPFAVLIDPNSKEPDGSDAKWWFVLDRMRKEEFEDKYKDKKGNIDYNPEDSKNDGDYVWFAEYMECNYKKGKLAEIKEFDEFGIAKTIYADPSEYTGDGEIVREREVEIPVWTRYLLTDEDMLEEPQEWPGKYSPLVRCPGDDLVIDGEVTIRSVISDAIGPQKMINFLESSIAEHLMLSPNAKYAGTAKQFGKHGAAWDNAHRTTTMRLVFDHDAENPGPPVPLQPPQVPGGLVNFLQENKQDMYDTTGIYPPSLGNTRRGESGKAIQAQQQEGDISTYVYIDNRTRAIEQCGRILVDLIPKVIDNNRNIRIRYEEDKEKVVPVNQYAVKTAQGEYKPVPDEMEGAPDVLDMYLNKGSYSVIVDTGPAYSTKRQEAAENLREFARSIGEVGQMAAPEIIRSMDIKDGDKIAEQFEKYLIRKGLREPEQTEDGQPEEPNPQQEAEMQARQTEMEIAKMEAEAKQIKAQADLIDAQAKMAETEQGIQQRILASQGLI